MPVEKLADQRKALPGFGQFGFPVSFSVGGKQYIAVSTGLGGGSPRLVPSTIASEIRNPESGNALYVFALPDKK